MEVVLAQVECSFILCMKFPFAAYNGYCSKNATQCLFTMSVIVNHSGCAYWSVEEQ